LINNKIENREVGPLHDRSARDCYYAVQAQTVIYDWCSKNSILDITHLTESFYLILFVYSDPMCPNLQPEFGVQILRVKEPQPECKLF
jgi:hypothetical protein